MDQYQRVYKFFLAIIYGICDFKLDYQYVSETTRFICEMIVDNSV